jgi:ABC transporter DrrB family efflux protein
MTTITTSTTLAGTGLGDARATPEPGANFLTTTAQSARRTLPTIMGALFLFIFRYIFGGAINTHSVDYVDFLIPGFLVSGVLWTGMNTPAGVAEDATSGVHDRFRSLPIPRSAVVAGRSLADSGLVVWTLLVEVLLGLAVGFRTHGDVGSVALACLLLLVTAYTFTWVFISLGLTSGNAQAAQALSTLVVVPLTFMSGAYVPVSSMPGWLQPIASNQPLNVIINAVRSLMLGGTDAAGVGHTTSYWVLLSLAWCAGIVVVFSTIAVARFSRTR